MYDVTFLFPYVPEVEKWSKPEFDVEFDDKKKCILVFFIFKIR